MNKFCLNILRLEHSEEPHQDPSLTKIFLLKCFAVFFLLVSFYPFRAYSVPPDFHKKIEKRNPSLELEKKLRIEKEIIQLGENIEKRIDSLISILLSEDTPRGNKLEIIQVIRSLNINSQPNINDKIETALTQLSQTGIEENKKGGGEEFVKNKKLSVWAIYQSEWIKVEQAKLYSLTLSVSILPAKFYVDFFAYLLTAVSGGLLFIPATQIALVAGKGFLLKALGVFLGTIAGVGGLSNFNYFLSEEDQKNISFFTEFIKINPFVSGAMHLLSATDENDKYLAERLSRATTLEGFIKELIPAIGDNKYSVPAQEALITALRGFSDIEEGLRREAIENLKQVIDNSVYPSLRQLAVITLGKIGEGVKGVAEYLIAIEDKKSKSDELSFLALIELGRDKNHFLISIEKLSTWFKERGNKQKRFAIQPEIPDSFLNSLLSKQQVVSENHIAVVKEFILSKILGLGLELKLKFSETLLSWDDSAENKAFLKEAYLNPAKDISAYVKKNLFKESLSDDDYEILNFLTNKLSTLEKTNPVGILYDIESIIETLKIAYPNQVEIAQTLEWLTTEVSALEKPNPIKVLYSIEESIIEDFEEAYGNQVEIVQKLENIVDSYKKMLKSIQN